MDSFDRELSNSSQGSSVNRPAKDLAALLAKNKERHPQNLRAVFVFSDGETSNQDHWSSAPAGDESDWDEVKQYVDGGLILGYGTPEGGPMKVLRLRSEGTQSGGEPEYIRDTSQPGNPVAISKIDEAALKAVASAGSMTHCPTRMCMTDASEQAASGAATRARAAARETRRARATSEPPAAEPLPGTRSPTRLPRREA